MTGNIRRLLKAADDGKYAVPAFNYSDEWELYGIIAAAEELGRRLAAELLDRGARELMSADAPEHRPPLVPRESTTAPPTVTDP